MSLDSTLQFEISGPGGGGKAPSAPTDSTQESNIGAVPSLGGSPGKNNFPSVNKPESSDIVKSVFFEDSIKGNPGDLDSTLEDILQISFSS